MPSKHSCLTDRVLHLNTTATLSVDDFAFRFWELRVQKRTRKQGKRKKAKGKSSRPTEPGILLLPFAFLLLPSLVINNPAVSEFDDPVSVRSVELRMRHLKDSRAGFVEPLEQLHDFLALIRMKISGRFVGEDDLRVRYHCAGDSD